MLCFSIDLFIEGFRFNFRTSPADLLRKLVSEKGDIDSHLKEFELIYKNVKQEGLEEDLKREQVLDRRRIKRIIRAYAKKSNISFSEAKLFIEEKESN